MAVSSILASDTYLNVIVFGLVVFALIVVATELVRWWWDG